MTAHQSTGVTVIERFTQDGWDWPNGCSDERWPAQSQPHPQQAVMDCPYYEVELGPGHASTQCGPIKRVLSMQSPRARLP